MRIEKEERRRMEEEEEIKSHTRDCELFLKSVRRVHNMVFALNVILYIFFFAQEQTNNKKSNQSF